jgi:hypothetical protein
MKNYEQEPGTIRVPRIDSRGIPIEVDRPHGQILRTEEGKITSGFGVSHNLGRDATNLSSKVVRAKDLMRPDSINHKGQSGVRLRTGKP